MTDNAYKIDILLKKLDLLANRQNSFLKEINELRDEVTSLQLSEQSEEYQIPYDEASNFLLNNFEESENTNEQEIPIVKQLLNDSNQNKGTPPDSEVIKPKIYNLEKYIGENLINKIGILITIIGVAIGTKYSIDHQLISPLTRIILGYLMGLGLLGFGAKLKNKYENFSAVLVSGSIAILYFITYFAYSFYDLLPQSIAFAMMSVLTGFTVFSSTKYDKQIISHLGLVGAYAVPFLLSDGSGRVDILFSYVAIINVGILLIAMKKYWLPLYYSSFILTWLIFTAGYFSEYRTTDHFVLFLSFLVIFASIFHTVFLAYKLKQKETFNSKIISLLVANSFIFFMLGYSIIDGNHDTKYLTGLFTLCNSIIHALLYFFIKKKEQTSDQLLKWEIILAVIFISIAVPVQFDDNWVTLLWAIEATIIFGIGRTKNISFAETLSYPLILLSFFSILHDWAIFNDSVNPDSVQIRFIPMLNLNFLFSVLFISLFSAITFLNKNKKYSSLLSQKSIAILMKFLIPTIYIILLYSLFALEISWYFNQLHFDSALRIDMNTVWNSDLLQFKNMWLINYSLLFFALLSIINIKIFKNRTLGLINISINTITVILFLTLGLYILSELRESFMNPQILKYYQSTNFNITLRYISYTFFALPIASIHSYIKQDFLSIKDYNPKISFEILLFCSILWIASSELITWMDLMNFSESYKLGLSILWGVYSLVNIILGIWKNKKHLRIGAIALFSITLLKLFFYDVAHLETIPKTIIFVLLGILLLIISFLYNKYKHRITDSSEG